MALNPKEPVNPKAAKAAGEGSLHRGGSGTAEKTASPASGEKKAAGKTAKKTATGKTAPADVLVPKKETASRPKTKAAAPAKSGAKTEKPAAKTQPAKAGEPAAKRKTTPAAAKPKAAAEKGTGSTAQKPAAEKTGRAEAAKDTASAAREAAQAKRAALGRTGPVGSIYASAVREGVVVPDLLEMRGDTMGGIYAAAVKSGAARQGIPEQPPETSIALEEEAAPEAETTPDAVPAQPLDGGPNGEEENETAGAEAGAAGENLSATGPMPTFGRKVKTAPKTEKKPFMWPKRLKKQTALNKQLARFFSLPPLRAIGGFLYLLGFSAECRVLQLWRFVRDTLVFVAQLLAWLFGGVFGAMGRFFASLLHDLAEPFVRLKDGLANTRRAAEEERKKAGGNPVKAAVAYFGAGVKSHRHLAGNLLGALLPLVATATLVFVVWSVMDTDYGLEVTVKGETIGYITDETVLEDAKAMLRGRLRLAGDQNMEDWKFDSTMALARASSFTSKDQLVNAMLRGGTADIVEGTGLYVDGKLVAVTTDGKKLKDYLDNMIAQSTDPGMPGAKVEFVSSVECDPSLDDVFLSSSVKEYDELIDDLTRTVREEERYTVQEGDTLGDVARSHGLLLETLLARNPQLESGEADYEPEAGEELLIRRAQPFLQVQTVLNQTYTEPIPYPVVEEETDQKALGFRRTTQAGVDGLQEVQDELVYIDGELVEQVRIEEQTRVLEEPVEQIIQIGTYDFANRETRDYNPAYMWPVPDYVYSSRGGGPGQGHRGRDINAPEGTPIYAANAGVVITSGWHYSYGNHIVIRHPDGLLTLYAHCSYLEAQVGDVVLQGQYIANVGNTGNSFGNHLHLEFQQQGGGLLNPDDYVAPPHGYALR